MNRKIQSVRNLSRILAGLKKKGKKIVFTNGCFDLIHTGHIKLFEKAKSLGDILVVAVNSDSSVRRNKGAGRPVVDEDSRMEVLSAIMYIDFVVKFGEDTPLETILALKPDIVVKGSDWAANKVVGTGYAKIARIPLKKGWATSNLIDRIKKLEFKRKDEKSKDYSRYIPGH